MIVGHKTFTPDETVQLERKMLVLESLTKLANQFAHDPSLQKLIDSLTLTISGQFTVTSVMMITRGNNLAASENIKSALGRFRDKSLPDNILSLSALLYDCQPEPKPIVLTELRTAGIDDELLETFCSIGTNIIVPLVAGNSLIGLILLGPRVGNLPFSETDLELLQHFVAAVTPLIANSFLYADVAALNARHLQILDNVRQAIFVFDSRGLLVTSNRTAGDMMKSILPEPPAKLEIGLPLEKTYPDEFFPGWSERFRSSLGCLEHRLPSTMTAKSPSGERVFNVRIGLHIPLSSSNEGIIVTLDDITEQTDIERRMFELEKFAEQGAIASSISHELNNHLAVLLGAVELTMLAQEKGDQSRMKSTLSKLREGITRMERFTAGLMNNARADAQKQPVQINDLVSDLFTFAAAQKRFSAVNLRPSLDRGLPPVPLDRDQITQVLINVLNNAADAIVETGRRDGTIIVSTALDNNELLLSVSDNGRGMTPEVKNRLFKTHFTTKPKGHGYGLRTCARILEQHDARISIESKIGFGTTFEFRFPVTAK